MSRWTLFCLILLAVASAAFRLWPTPAQYLELDSAIYLRAAGDYHRALVDGSWTSRALTPQNYTAIAYWPPLFPMLAGLVGNAWTVAGLAGWLTLFPAFFLARRLWGDDGTALAAAALVGLHPFLAWYARVPRTEGLFLLLNALALALVLAPRRGGSTGAQATEAMEMAQAWPWLVGGGCLGLGYATRFDELLLLPAVLVAVLVLRGRLAAGWTFAGFLLTALPYLVFLAWLNGGAPTLISAEKSLYDTLEGAWTASTGQTMYEFTARFGLPGLIRVDRNDPLVQTLLGTKVPGLVLQGLLGIPASLASASWNWTLLLVPVGLSLLEFRDRRSQALLWLLLPVPVVAVLTSWDPNPRYYSFTLVPLCLLAARGLTLLASTPAPDRLARWAVFGLAAPMQVAAAWLVPTGEHFDQRGPVDHAFLELLPQARDLQAAVLFLGFGAAGMLAWRYRFRWAGLAGSALALAVIGGPVGVALGQAEGLYRLVLPLSLAGLACLPLLAWATLPEQLWGPPMRRWLLAAMGLVALQNGLVLAGWDLAHTRLVHCPPVAAFLASQPQGTRLLAYQQVDALRSGAEWVPLQQSRGLGQVLQREQPDFVLLPLPETGSAAGAVVTVPDLESSGMVELVGTYPAGGGVAGCPRAWRLYRVLPSGARPPTSPRLLPDRTSPLDFPRREGMQ